MPSVLNSKRILALIHSAGSLPREKGMEKQRDKRVLVV